MDNKEYIWGLATGTAASIAAVILLQLGGMDILPTGKSTFLNKHYREKIEYLEDMIEDQYLYEVNKDDLAEGLYAGLFAGLGDPYSCYFTADAYEQEMTTTDGEYVGIGVSLQKNEEGGIEIIEVYKGSPAEEAGLLPHDLIIAVDDEDITEWETGQLVDKIRHGGMESAVLTVYEEEAIEPKKIKVEIREVFIPAVEYEMLQEQTGYIHLMEFTGITAGQFKEAYENLNEQGMEKLVVDIRDNPGGTLDSVCEILDWLLPEGTLVYMEDKNGERITKYSDKDEVLKDLPIVTLINRNSASAAEIFAGAMHDYGKGILMGTRTFGKGIVQGLQPLNDGSAVKITIASYYTPNGDNIHKKGIEPDVEVPLDEALLNRSEYTREEDNQLQEAIAYLKTH